MWSFFYLLEPQTINLNLQMHFNWIYDFTIGPAIAISAHLVFYSSCRV